MVLNRDGRVGIGTTSPQALTELSSASAEQKLWLSKANSGTANQHGMWLQFANYGPAATARTGDTIIGKIHFYASQPTSGNLQDAAAIECRADGNQSGGVTPSYLSFKTTATSTATERVRIDSNGRLLVGTSTAKTRFSYTPELQVEGTGTDAGIALARYSNDGISPTLTFSKSRSTSIGGNGLVSINDDLGAIYFTGADGNDQNSIAVAILAEVDGTPGNNDMPGRLRFLVTADGASSPTERMRLDNRGQLMLQSTTSTFDVATTQAAGTSYSTIFSRHSSTSGSPGTGTVSFRVYSNGNVQNTNNSYGALSDIKLKENIVDAGSQWDDLKALRVRNYNLKEGETHTQIGLVAQEVEPISPGLVYETPDRDADGNDLGTTTKAVQYSVLYMKAVKALQEAMERIETLEAKVAALETP